jgi:hypothetical protein
MVSTCTNGSSQLAIAMRASLIEAAQKKLAHDTRRSRIATSALAATATPSTAALPT